MTEKEKLFNLISDELEELTKYVNLVLDRNELEPMWDTLFEVRKAKNDVKGFVNDKGDE